MTGVGVAIPATRMDDHFVAALVHALADPLVDAGMTLVTRVVQDADAEQRVYRHWASVGGISGVALLDVVQEDPRVPLLRSLGFPLAAVVDVSLPADFPAVVVDLGASISVLTAFLATRRHRRAVYIMTTDEQHGAPSPASAMEAAGADGLFRVVRTEHSVSAAIAAGVAVLESGPATLVFDSDVHAAAALTALRDRGTRVPEDAAIISWTNSALCQSTSRTITAIDRRGGEIGTLLGARILGAVGGDRNTHDRAPDPFVVLGETA